MARIKLKDLSVTQYVETRGTTPIGLIGLRDRIRGILEAIQLDEVWELFDSHEQLVEDFRTE